MHINDLAELDRRAVLASLPAVQRADDLGVPTPCAGWALGDLLAHMSVQHRGFARAVAGERTSVEDWRPPALADAAVVADYRAAVETVGAAFGAATDPDAPALLPELRDAPVPAVIAMGFHLVDYVVHGWDVATSVGTSIAFDDDVLAAALDIARRVPDGPERSLPGASFAPAHPVPTGAGALDEILLRLGRTPR